MYIRLCFLITYMNLGRKDIREVRQYRVRRMAEIRPLGVLAPQRPPVE